MHTPTPLPDAVFRFGVTVGPGVIDENGHVNNVAYVQWMQDAAVRHSDSTGGTAAMRAAGGMWVARSHRIEYLRPAFAGEVLEVRTWIANAQRVRSLRRYDILRPADGALLARGETDWVFLDAATTRLRSIPDEVLACYTVVPDPR
jgi:acyl-CoA thioester hydrolase